MPEAEFLVQEDEDGILLDVRHNFLCIRPGAALQKEKTVEKYLIEENEKKKNEKKFSIVINLNL